MIEFIKKSLTYKGEPSSKRIISFIAVCFFMLAFIGITLYLMFGQPIETSSIERNLVILLTAAGSVAIVPQGLSSLEKFKKGE